MFKIEGINLNNKRYKVQGYLKNSQLAIEIESDSNKYSNQYNLDELQKVFPYFKQANSLDESLDYL